MTCETVDSGPAPTAHPGMTKEAGFRMIITAIRTHFLEAALSQPFAYSRAWYDTRTAMLVEIETDSGLVGWGEGTLEGKALVEVRLRLGYHRVELLSGGELAQCGVVRVGGAGVRFEASVPVADVAVDHLLLRGRARCSGRRRRTRRRGGIACGRGGRPGAGRRRVGRRSRRGAGFAVVAATCAYHQQRGCDDEAARITSGEGGEAAGAARAEA